MFQVAHRVSTRSSKQEVLACLRNRKEVEIAARRLASIYEAHMYGIGQAMRENGSSKLRKVDRHQIM